MATNGKIEETLQRVNVKRAKFAKTPSQFNSNTNSQNGNKEQYYTTLADELINGNL